MAEDKDKNSLKSRLEGIKSFMQNDDLAFNVNDSMANMKELPSIENTVKYIDYELEKMNNLEYADTIISNIIGNYVTNDKLAESYKFKSIREQQIIKLAEIQFLVKNSERNLILLQETIDGGDMTKDMFDMVKGFQGEMRLNIEARSKHVDKCESYWSNYNTQLGMENKEQTIMNETEVKVDVAEKKIMSHEEINDYLEKISQKTVNPKNIPTAPVKTDEIPKIDEMKKPTE